MTVSLHPSGDQCLMIEFGSGVDVEVNRRACAFALAIEAAAFPFTVDVVPSFTGVGLHYRAEAVPVEGPGESPHAAVCRLVQQLLARPFDQASDAGRVVEIPVCYGGPYGPDFDEVAAACGVSGEQLIDLHAGVEARVFMIGFAPGSPYLGLWDQRLALPRRRTPRTLVPAGTVAIANRQSVIYAYDLPGGWNLIGRTPLKMFDPARAVPFLLRAGDRVKFVAVSEQQYLALAAADPRPRS